MTDRLTGFGEPWKSPWEPGVDGNEFVDCEGLRVLGADYYDGPLLAVEERYARRIVAAVNACQGIPTETLEHVDGVAREAVKNLGEDVSIIVKLTRERDEARAMVRELAAALKEAQRIANISLDDWTPTDQEDWKKMNVDVPSLLAKAEALS